MPETVVMRESQGSANEPEAICESCGVQGTIGRAVRTDEDAYPIEIHRFCLACWPEQLARFRARWREENRVAVDRWMRNPKEIPMPPSRGFGLEAVSWHLTLEFVSELRRPRGELATTSAEDHARIAADIMTRADQMVGEMPCAVEMYLREYGGWRSKEEL